MDTEKLRELEREMRVEASHSDEKDADALNAWADRLRDILAAQPPKAELGQEVGAVADAAALLVRDVCEMAPSDPDAPDTVCIRVADLTRIAELYTSPAHTSEARDAVVGEVVEIGDDDEGQPRILIHTTREAIKNGPPLAFRTVSVAAMRQEAGDEG